MKPEFTHDCDRCEFYGHFLGMDIYVCPGGGSIIARYGNDGPEYNSMPLSMFRRMLTENGLIRGDDFSLLFQEYIFSHYAPEYYRAWLLALSAKE